jgi:hypothetical protein
MKPDDAASSAHARLRDRRTKLLHHLLHRLDAYLQTRPYPPYLSQHGHPILYIVSHINHILHPLSLYYHHLCPITQHLLISLHLFIHLRLSLQIQQPLFPLMKIHLPLDQEIPLLAPISFKSYAVVVANTSTKV